MDNSPVQDILPFLKLYLPFVFAIGSFFYFAPTWIGRYKRSFWSIFALNFLLGWTVIGWLVALLWSVTADKPLFVRSRGFVPEQPPEVYGPPTPPFLERIDWRTVVGGAALSILMVAVLFAIVSQGRMPLSFTPVAKSVRVTSNDAKPNPSSTVQIRRSTEIQASN